MVSYLMLGICSDPIDDSVNVAFFLFEFLILHITLVRGIVNIFLIVF